jgi:hypothetical protein
LRACNGETPGQRLAEAVERNGQRAGREQHGAEDEAVQDDTEAGRGASSVAKAGRVSACDIERTLCARVARRKTGCKDF